MHVLVADDDPISKKLVTAVLAGMGFEVTSFEDGGALWAEYEQRPAPLVVTDWVMPEMSGVELCRRIRAHHAPIYTHVVIVTSLSPAEHTLEAFRAGVDDFVGKPLDPELFTLQMHAASRAIQSHAMSGARRSLEVCQSALGPEHVALLDPLEDLATLTREQRSFTRCRAFLRRQLDIALRGLGPHHPRTRELSLELEEMVAYAEVA